MSEGNDSSRFFKHFKKARESGDFERLRVIGFEIILLVELLGLNVSELRELFSSS